MRNFDKSITFVLEKDLYERITKLAARDKVSRANVVRSIVERHIEEREAWTGTYK